MLARFALDTAAPAQEDSSAPGVRVTDEADREERLLALCAGASSAAAVDDGFAAIGPRFDHVGLAVTRRRDRERSRIDEYFALLLLMCDDALHVLCETCAPDASGRSRCPVCRPDLDARRST
jgi:hypothetical protein